MKFGKLLHILLLIAVGLSQTGLAQEVTTGSGPQVYQVEIILFRFIDPASTSTEAFSSPDSAVSSDAQAGTKTSLNETTGRQLRRLPVNPESQRLGDVNRQLSASGAYKVLAYRSWLQLLNSQKNAEVLPLTDMDIESNTASGYLQVYQEQSVYLAPDIQLGGSLSGKKPTIKGARQIPLGKPVYFDHPQFGLIAMITRSDSEWPAE
jgi:Peptidoglycan-binding protein, CsiV